MKKDLSFSEMLQKSINKINKRQHDNIKLIQEINKSRELEKELLSYQTTKQKLKAEQLRKNQINNIMDLQNTEEKQKELTPEQILKELSGFYGSENFYKDNFALRKSIYTDGFKKFMELLKCEWLYSDMSIYCSMKLLNKEDFIICKIIKNKDNSAVVYLFSDFNNDEPLNSQFNKSHLLYKQEYAYTDFALNEYEFYIIYNELNKFTFLLKSEY